MIIAVSGLVFDPNGNKGSAGAGKSTVTDRLVAKHKFVEVAFADVMKRFCMELFGFSEQQLWGPSEFRNKEDERFVRYTAFDNDGVNPGLVAKPQYLTPRLALQLLGTEWGRVGCFPDVWVAYGMRVAERIQEGELYDKVTGVRYFPKVDSMIEVKKNVVFSDMRFKNEFDYIRKNGGKLVRVRRPVEKLAVSSDHQSENDLNDVPDEDFDYVIHGQPADVLDLQLRTDEMMDWLTGRIRNFDEKQADVPPFLRNS